MPRADTLDRLLKACGWELDMTLRRGEGEDRSLIRALARPDTAERASGGAATAAYRPGPRAAMRAARPAS